MIFLLSSIIFIKIPNQQSSIIRIFVGLLKFSAADHKFSVNSGLKRLKNIPLCLCFRRPQRKSKLAKTLILVPNMILAGSIGNSIFNIYIFN